MPERARSADAGLFRIGAHASGARRPGRLRPVRLAVSAALAAGAVGGVAAAATTGVLPTPFGGDKPAPGASVTAPASPDRPLVSPSTGGGPGGRSGVPTPGSTTGGSSDGDARDNARDGATPGQDPTGGPGDRSAAVGGGWKRLASACRDLRDGKGLDFDRKRVLNGAAGGSSRVWTYCKGLLKAAEGGSGDDAGRGQGEGGGQDGHGQGDQGGRGDQGGDDGTHIGGGHPGKGIGMPPVLGPLLPKTGPVPVGVSSPHPYSAL
ncbi:hypothetical protein [Streptomyces sp. NPDC046197]|uniref:hypothetical protein n=1 Tax=Streptomyces sp. NPDC046197 TaxID=3154337 RepID=UPI0033D89950